MHAKCRGTISKLT
jgi:hypothetical protein